MINFGDGTLDSLRRTQDIIWLCFCFLVIIMSLLSNFCAPTPCLIFWWDHWLAHFCKIRGVSTQLPSLVRVNRSITSTPQNYIKLVQQVWFDCWSNHRLVCSDPIWLLIRYLMRTDKAQRESIPEVESLPLIHQRSAAWLKCHREWPWLLSTDTQHSANSHLEDLSMDKPAEMSPSLAHSSSSSCSSFDECQDPRPVVDACSQISMLLEFKNPSLEKEFLLAANAAWIKCDLVACNLSMVLAMAKILSWKNPSIIPSLTHHTSVIVFAVCLPLLLLKRMRADPIEYQKQRMTLFFYLKLCLGAAQAAGTYIENPWSEWASRRVSLILWNLLCKSTAPMMILAIGPPLPFRHSIIVQALCSVLGFAWVGNLCLASVESPELQTSIHVLGWRTEGFLRKLSLGSFLSDPTCPSQGEYPCWLWGVFSTFLLVFMVPSYLLYLLEYRFRIRFLQCRMQEEHTVFLVGRVVMISLLFVVLSQLIWFKAKLLALWTGWSVVLICYSSSLNQGMKEMVE